jgi:hypothetical protein
MTLTKIITTWSIALTMTAVLFACHDDETSAGKTSLQQKIAEAEQVHDAAVEGIELGDYALGSRQTLQDKIDWAYYILQYAGNDEGYVNATDILQQAIDAFNVNIVKSGVPKFANTSYFNLGAVEDLLPNHSNFTIECRIKLDDLLTDGYAGLGSFITADDGFVGILFRYTASGAIESYIFADGWFGAVTPGSVLEPGTWYHLSMSFDGYALRVYVDGAEMAVAESGTELVPEVEPDSPFFVGMSRNFEFNAGDQRSMHGNIQEVRFWDHARTAEAITADADKQLEGTEEGLTAYWPFDVNIGSTVNDKTGNFVAKGKNVTWE